MARKVERKKGAAPKGAASASEIGVLHPTRTFSIAKRVVEVREYGFVEGLKVQAGTKVFLDDLYTLFDKASAPPPAEAVSDVFAEHIVTVHWLIAQAITPINDHAPTFVADVGENAKWVAGLTEIEGDALMAIWWEVNKGFFTRRLQRRRQAAQAQKSQASPASTTG